MRKLLTAIAVFAAAFLLIETAVTRKSAGQSGRFSRVNRNGVPDWKVDPEFADDVFTFVRIRYNSYSGWGRWATDYPDSDLNFSYRLQQLTSLKVDPQGKILELSDERLFDYPFIYLIEPGGLEFTHDEIEALRRYLLNGGFLMVDDFWGTWEWANFESEIKRVLPEYQIVEIPLDHPVFNTVYNIEEIVQVPNLGNAQRGRRTWEQDGVVPHVRGIFDEAGRLMVIINWNTDIGDAWEWAEHPYYPLKYSTYAIEITVNIIVYAMSH